MTIFSASPNLFHRSVFHRVAGPLDQAIAAPRHAGAIRYKCPDAGSFVLLTDPDSLAGFNSGDDTLRHRCGACGEMHLLRIEDGGQN